MRSRSNKLIATAAFFAVALAAPAQAGFFPATSVDGPNTGVVSFGDADLARDGDGAVAYVRQVGGVNKVFVSLIVDGVPQAPEQVDDGLPAAAPSSNPSVGVAAGGRVVVSFISGALPGNLYAVDRQPGGGFSDAKPVNANPANLFADTDMGPNGVAYTVYVTKVGAQHDLRASRYENGAWTPVGDAFAGPLGKLEGDATKNVGEQTETRPRVAVDGAGNGVVAFAEGNVGVDQLKVQLRRLNGTTPGDLVEASVPTLEGAARANTAWMADVDTDDAGNASVTFREDFTYGGTDKARVLVRRLPAGTTTFSPPVVYDGLPLAAPIDNGAEQPRVDVNAGGAGLAAARRQMMPFHAYGASLANGAWSAFGRVDSDVTNVVPEPVPAVAGTGAGLIAWKSGDTMRARYGLGSTLFPEANLSNPLFGPIEAGGTHEAAADGFGDAIIGFTQGAAANRRIVVATFDLPPTAATPTTTESYSTERRPTLRWNPAADVWGPVSYRVEVDGKTAGTTSANSFQLVNSLGDGIHSWRVVAIDSRGQEQASAFRAYRLDVKKPSVSLTIKGKRRVGSKLTFSIRISDGRGSGYRGIKFAVTGGKTASGTRVTRTLRKKGKINIKITVKDAVGNVTTIKKTIRIAAAPKKKKRK